MPNQPLFAGLIVDESDQPVTVEQVGDESFYVVNDAGFLRHVPSEEDLLTDQTAKMIGQDDIFSRAMIMNQLKHMDEQFDQLLRSGIPEEGRAYLGMMGFRIVVNIHGDVVRLDQPSAPAGEEGDE
jgi:hypothetical protein